MSPNEKTRKPAKRGGAAGKKNEIFTEEERAAMREYVREKRAAARGDHVNGESEVLAKIAQMKEPDRTMATRLHALMREVAPVLSPKTWYGMPAYAKGGKVVCFFQSGQKFKTRYATLGFSDTAHLDEGNMWPNSYALTKLGAAEETKIRALLKKALS